MYPPVINNWEIGHSRQKNSSQTLDDRQISSGIPGEGKPVRQDLGPPAYLSGGIGPTVGEGGGSQGGLRGPSKLRGQKWEFGGSEA